MNPLRAQTETLRFPYYRSSLLMWQSSTLHTMEAYFESALMKVRPCDLYLAEATRIIPLSRRRASCLFSPRISMATTRCSSYRWTEAKRADWHGIKTLGIAKIVGTETSRAALYTSGVSLMDGLFVGLEMLLPNWERSGVFWRQTGHLCPQYFYR